MPGHDEWRCPRTKFFELRCQTALLRRISDHNYVVPLLRIYERDDNLWFVDSITNESKSLKTWRDTSKPSSVARIRAMLEVAKAIRYLHSIGTVFDRDIELDEIFLDSNLHAKIRTLCSTWRYLSEKPVNYAWSGLVFEKALSSYETNVFIFGCFFYETYFDRTIYMRWVYENSKVSERPSEPAIREDAWQLIQRCCADDRTARPSMDQVVQEMESWDLS
ncbi:Protein kinase-like domain containing protein [Amanita muscaria]